MENEDEGQASTAFTRVATLLIQSILVAIPTGVIVTALILIARYDG